MLELEFTEFMKIIENNMQRRNQDKRYLQFYEDDNKFILYIKSIDYWEYFTVIPKTVIATFGAGRKMSEEESVKEFKMNFLYNAVQVKDVQENPVKKEIEIVKEVIVEQKDSFIGEPEIIEEEIVKEVIVEQEDTEIEKTVEKESDAYNDFLVNMFKSWEYKILDFVDNTLSDTIINKKFDVVNKSFSEFMRQMFGTIKITTFVDKLRDVMKIVLNEGVEEAEKELNINVSLGDDIENDITSATNRQINGFFIGGNHWPGIKGVSEELQSELRESVVKSIESKESLKDIKTNIKDTFKKYTGTDMKEGRATAIARTESNRIRNAGKLRTYKDSGLIGKKRWDAFFDNRTSELCKRLHNQEVGLFDKFIDIKTGEGFEIPPSHVNCRCRITFIPEE